jgi:replicative superfamily II helicase
MIERALYAAAFFLLLISASTAGGKTTVGTVSAAAKTLPTIPTRER